MSAGMSSSSAAATLGMDAAAGAYAMGAESVTCIDVQKPAAFAHEIAHIEALGGKRSGR